MEPVIGGAIVKTFTWLWKDYGKEFAGKKWTEFVESKRFEQAASDYARDMHERYGSIKILGMDSPIPLEGIYTRVSMLAKPTIFTYIPKEQLEQIYINDCSFGEVLGKPKNGFDVFLKYNRIFILGKPGAGKTTFLKYIILQTTTGTKSSIPICIELRRFADTGKTLMEYIVDQFDICNFPDAEAFIVTVLKHGKALVLCDGLDEVNKENGLRNKIIDQLRDFSDKYNKNRFVITCRIAATEYNFEKFDYVEMADFDEEQIEMFIGKWFIEDDEIHRMFLTEFKKSEHKRLRELASNPLLLTLLCLAFKENLSFPFRRSEIYGEALDALMKKWDSTRNIKRDDIYRNLSSGRKLNMLARIAAECYEKKEYLHDQPKLEKMIVAYLQTLPQAGFAEDIDGEAVLKTIEAQHGVLVERTQKVYSFSHKTFQEYLTAKYIIDNAHKGTLKALLDNHLLDDNWYEVILLTAEMLDDADKFFELFYNKLDEMAQKDNKLMCLLIEAKKSANESIMEFPFPVNKNLVYIQFYLTLSRSISRAFAKDVIEIVSRDSIVGNALGPCVAFTGGGLSVTQYVYNLSLGVAAVKINKFNNIYGLVQTNAFALAMENGLDVTCELFSDSEWEKHDIKQLSTEMVKICKDIGNPKIYNDLKQIDIPENNSNEESINRYVDEISSFWIKYGIYVKYTLTMSQAKSIGGYLQTSKLLLDCLENASVSDREGLKDRLLMPPAG